MSTKTFLLRFSILFLFISPIEGWTNCTTSDSLQLDEAFNKINGAGLWKTDLAAALLEFETFEKAAATCPYYVSQIKLMRANAYSYNDQVLNLYLELKATEKHFEQNKQHFKDEENLFYINYFWGRYYYLLGNFPDAELRYEKATEVLDLLKKKGNLNLEPFRATTLRQQGVLRYKMGRNQESIAILEKAYALEKSPLKKSLNKKQIGKAYFKLGDYQLAEQYYQEAKLLLNQNFPKSYSSKKSSKQKNKMITLLNEIARLNLTLGKEKNDSKYYNQALATIKESLLWHEDTVNYYKLPITLGILGELLLETRDFPKAEYYFLKAKGVASSNFDKAKTLIQLSKIYQQQNRSSKAIDTINLALQYLDESLLTDESKSTSSIPNPSTLDALTLKAEYLLGNYSKTKNKDQLHSAWKTINKATIAFEQILQFYDSFDDKENLVAKSYNLFELAITAGYELYKRTGEQKYINQSFLFAEQSKAILLKDVFKKTYAQQLGIPELLREKDLIYKQRLFKLDDQIKKKQYNNERSGEAYSALLNQYLDVKEKYQFFNTDTLAAFPKYNAFVNTSFNGTEELKNLQNELKPNHCILEYFIGTKKVYAFILRANSPIEIVDLNIKLKELENTVIAFSHCSKSYNEVDCFETWPSESYKLFQLIFQPIEDKLTNHVTIIPDGLLCYIPFATLISKYQKIVKGQKTPYADLAYLLHQHVFNYNYSAFTSFNDSNNFNTNSSYAFSGFAPSFNAKNADIAEALGNPNARYGTIEGSTTLIQKIANHYGSSKSILFKDEEGTKHNFLQHAPQSKVIHLHTHGTFDTYEPNQSYIAFHQKENSVDSNLYIRELYAMELNADIVTTAVCYSGDGMAQKGQGIISLARGFFYAGAKSVFPSLWEGNNQSLSEITDLFYQQLAKGLDGASAMNKAKIRYLKNHQNKETAYPYYWGSYIGIGKTPVEKDASFFNWKIILFLSVSVFIVLFFSKKMKH